MGRQCLARAGKHPIAAAWVARVGRVRSCVDDLALYPSYKMLPQTAQAKKPAARKIAGFSSRRRRLRDGGEVLLMFLPCGASGMAAIGAAYGAMRERGRLRLDKLMP